MNAPIKYYGVMVNNKIVPRSVGLGRNKASKRYLGDKHTELNWHRAYNHGARIVQLSIKLWDQ